MPFYYKKFHSYIGSGSNSKNYGKDTTYLISLENGAYKIKRDYLEDRSGDGPEVQRYEMQPEYTGRLFNILAKSLFYSIGQYINENSDDPTIEEEIRPVYVTVHNNGITDNQECFYIKLHDGISFKSFKKEISQNEETVINDWAAILKSHPYIKPFLNKETEFISWNPGRGAGSGNIVSSVSQRINNPLTDGKKYKTIYTDPENMGSILAYNGTLKLKCGQTYAYDSLMKTYNEKIQSFLLSLPFYDILDDDDAIENLSLEDAFKYSNDFGMPKEYDKLTNKVKDCTYLFGGHESLPKKPELGDRELVTNGNGAVQSSKFLKQEYPKLYYKINDLINEFSNKCEEERHKKAEQEYNLERLSYDTLVSNKQTNEYIKESFAKFKEVYNNEGLPEDLDDLEVYLQDLFGCVADYLSEKGTQVLNEYINEQQIAYLKQHPKKKQYELRCTNTVFLPELIYKNTNIKFFPDKGEIHDIMIKLNNLTGGFIPCDVYSRPSIKIVSQNNKDDAEIVKKQIGKSNVSLLYVYNRGVELKLEVCILLPLITTFTGKDFFGCTNASYNIKPTEELIEFKQRIYKEILSCYTGDFDLKLDDAYKNWEGDYPPLDICMTYDEEKMDKVIEDIKNDRVYNKLCWLEKQYYEAKRKK